jgi:hypothetical protein
MVRIIPRHVVAVWKNHTVHNAFSIYHFGIDSVPTNHIIDLYFYAYFLSYFMHEIICGKKSFPTGMNSNLKIPQMGDFV